MARISREHKEQNSRRRLRKGEKVKNPKDSGKLFAVSVILANREFLAGRWFGLKAREVVCYAEYSVFRSIVFSANRRVLAGRLSGLKSREVARCAKFRFA
jgi:hypothetical protein